MIPVHVHAVCVWMSEFLCVDVGGHVYTRFSHGLEGNPECRSSSSALSNAGFLYCFSAAYARQAGPQASWDSCLHPSSPIWKTRITDPNITCPVFSYEFWGLKLSLTLVELALFPTELSLQSPTYVLQNKLCSKGSHDRLTNINIKDRQWAHSSQVIPRPTPPHHLCLSPPSLSIPHYFTLSNKYDRGNKIFFLLFFRPCIFPKYPLQPFPLSWEGISFTHWATHSPLMLSIWLHNKATCRRLNTD